VLLTLGLMLVLADCCFIDKSSSRNNLTSNNQCNDISNHGESSHSHGSEDNVLIVNSTPKSSITLSHIDIIPILNDNIKTNYNSTFWQPPRLS
jgi:hypothetical protein